MSPMPEQTQPTLPTVNPLGGRIHTNRLGSGFSAYVRICPACRWENAESDRFCISCGASLSGVAKVSSTQSSAGVAALSRRMGREQRVASRQRPPHIRGGEGLFTIGLVFLLVMLAVNPEQVLAVPIWIISVVLITLGVWQLRANAGSLRTIGIVLAMSATLLLGFVGVRAIQSSNIPPLVSEPIDNTMLPTITNNAIGTPAADGIAGEVTMVGANEGHTGEMPGPAPTSAPRLAWQFDTGGEVNGAATLSKGRLFVMSKSGSLVALDAESGKQLWAAPITGYVTHVSPAVTGDLVLAGGGFSFGAWDVATGEQRWSVPLPYLGQASPTVHDGLVIVSSQERWSYGLDVQTGEIRWRVATEGIVFGAAAIFDEQAIYATDEGIVYAVDLDSGRVVWRRQVNGSVFASPVVSNGVVLVTTQTGELFALNAESGSLRWSTLQGGTASVASDGETVVVSSSDGGVYGLELDTGDQRWLYPTGKVGLTAPALSDGLALIGAGNTLLAIDLSTGIAAWYYLAGDQIDAAPIVADGHVYFGSRDGFLTAVTDSP